MRVGYAIPLALGVIAIAGFAGSLGASAGGTQRAPTQEQIRRAVNTAERSSSLWATINICNTKHHPRELGIRGQMPALAFPTELYMTVHVDYRPHPGSRFKPDPGAEKHLYLGRRSTYLRQAGVTFVFKQRAVLAGTITFAWKLNGRTIGRVKRTTSAHHKHVDYADPPGYSAAVCAMG